VGIPSVVLGWCSPLMPFQPDFGQLQKADTAPRAIVDYFAV
jgi:hypothetical protein